MEKKDGKYRKTLFCSQFQTISDGEQVFDMFLLISVKYNSNTRGVKWLELKLQDNSGTISARVWADNIRSEYDSMEGQPVFVKGCVNFYAGRPEITVEMLRVVKDGEFELSELCRMVPEDIVNGDIHDMERLISSIKDESVRDFTVHILTKDRMLEMASLPVHLYGHHNYRGGLLEHTFEVAFGSYYHAKVTGAARRYPLDLDMIISGALLHDIAVINRIAHCGYGYRERAFSGIAGNFPLYEILAEARWQTGLSDMVFAHVSHIIEASHEDGVPKTAEAMMVRSANLLSIENNRLEDTLWSRRATCGDKVWSRVLERDVYRFGKEEDAAARGNKEKN